jgi:heme oxygenase (mycobilin-producing)
VAVPPTTSGRTEHAICDRRVRWHHVARSSRGLRVLETSHAPVYYLPREDVRAELLDALAMTTWCEFKGAASYADLVVGDRRSPQACWWYASPDAGVRGVRPTPSRSTPGRWTASPSTARRCARRGRLLRRLDHLEGRRPVQGCPRDRVVVIHRTSACRGTCVTVTTLAGATRRTKVHDVSVVKINVLQVPEGRGEMLEQRFATRAGEVEKVDGFESFELLRPTEGTDRYLVITRWRDEDAFQGWLNSSAFQKGHARRAAARVERWRGRHPGEVTPAGIPAAARARAVTPAARVVARPAAPARSCGGSRSSPAPSSSRERRGRQRSAGEGELEPLQHRVERRPPPRLEHQVVAHAAEDAGLRAVVPRGTDRGDRRRDRVRPATEHQHG